MDKIIQVILDNSKLELHKATISNATDTTFNMSLNCRVVEAGAFHSTIEPMRVSLAGPGGVFCELDVPVVETTPTGGDFVIEDHPVEIIDKEAFMAFVNAVLKQERVKLKMANGITHVAALGLRAPMTYSKEIEINGMNGPQIEVASIETDSKTGTTKTSLRINNPSPFEMDIGETVWDFLNTAGEKVVELHGALKILPGETLYELEGRNLPIQDGHTHTNRIGTAKGLSVKGGKWTNEAVQMLSLPIRLPAFDPSKAQENEQSKETDESTEAEQSENPVQDS